MRKRSRWLRNTAICWLFSGLLLARPCVAGGLAPIIVVPPLDVSVLFIDIATFTVVATSLTTMNFQWLKNGTNIPGATASSYSIPNPQSTDAGTYSVKVSNAGGSVTSSPASLTVLAPPGITSQPQNQAVVQGQGASFSVAASSSAAMTYQWRFNGTNLSGAISSTLTLTNLQPNQIGNYAALVANSYGSVTSAVATLTVYVAPSIQTQPQNQAISRGQSFTLSVAPNGSAPFSYQWNLNNSPVAGATASSLTLSNAQMNAAGSYSVVVTNIGGSITSAVATVSVTLPNTSLSVSTNGANAGMNSNGFNLELSVPVGITYVVQASTNWVDWTPIATNTASSATIAFTDPAAANYSRRFYRVMVP
ncbi:MAG: hypothetical protein JWR19_2393 [Pedosphaera sp.]|nr:hypothetical protein [Pedosphaera sp.]